MQDLTVICANCGAEVAVTESLAAPLIEATRKEFERRLAEKNREIRDQSDEMARRSAELSQAEAALDETIQQRLKAATLNLTAEAEKKARAEVEEEVARRASELASAEQLLEKRTAALKEFPTPQRNYGWTKKRSKKKSCASNQP